MLIISETLQTTPCQASAHGSPPEAVQPGSGGAPSAAYKPLIAITDIQKIYNNALLKCR